MTVLWLMVPPALCKVLPKTAKKMMGAIILLNAKKYWTLVALVGSRDRGVAVAVGSYLSVRDA
jgi:hypothetical protein